MRGNTLAARIRETIARHWDVLLRRRSCQQLRRSPTWTSRGGSPTRVEFEGGISCLGTAREREGRRTLNPVDGRQFEGAKTMRLGARLEGRYDLHEGRKQMIAIREPRSMQRDRWHQVALPGAATLGWTGTSPISPTLLRSANLLMGIRRDHRRLSACRPCGGASPAVPGNLGPWVQLKRLRLDARLRPSSKHANVTGRLLVVR